MSKLTNKELEALGLDDDGATLREDGGLIGTVKCSPSRTSVYFDWRYRYDGKVRQIQVGSWPKMSMPEIRRERDRLAALVQDSLDPATLRKAERLAKKAEQAETIAKQEARIAEAEALQARLTVEQLFIHWEKIELSRRKDKGVEVRRCFQKDIFPTLGHVAAKDVRRAMITHCLDKVVERGARIIARNLLGDLRQMFGFAIKRGYVENDPTSHLKRDDFGKKVERDRVLSPDEIKQLAVLLPNSGLHRAAVAAIWIMLSTCCRVGEISGARWSNIDLNTGKWRIPPDNAKNGKEHTVTLSDFARSQFELLKQLATDDLGQISEWVMPASQKNGAVCRNSLAKMIGDRQRGESEPMTNRSKRTSALILPRGKWTPHDLRRTGATMMGELGVRPDVIEKCLNHVEQNRLVRIYQRQTLSEEQAEAWRLLGDRLKLLTSPADNVVPVRFKNAGR